MGTLYAHRLNHGEGCGYSVELSREETTFTPDVTVYPVTSEMIQKFLRGYAELNTREEILLDFINFENMERFLINCATVKSRKSGQLTENEKNFVTDAEIDIEDQIETGLKVKEAA